jgi:AraC-like DNA-binding protein
VKKVIFDSTEIPGDQRERTERWIEALSSGYVRLGAEPTPGLPFEGKLKITQLQNTTVGTLVGTVRNISRSIADVVFENTDNVVLLFNRGTQVVGIEQNGRSAECVSGGAILIEQCEPSMIKVAAPNICNLVAIQAPRDQVRRECRRLTDRFLIPIAASSAVSLTRAYVEFLLDQPDCDDPLFVRLASDHVTDLVAATVDSEGVIYEERLRGSRAARFAILREIDRNFMDPGFSLTVLARRLSVTPRYVQVLLAVAETSFTDELTKRRLDRASDLLTSSRSFEKSVMEISQECGFSTVSHFHRVFRRRFGMTPGELREQSR